MTQHRMAAWGVAAGTFFLAGCGVESHPALSSAPRHPSIRDTARPMAASPASVVPATPSEGSGSVAVSASRKTVPTSPAEARRHSPGTLITLDMLSAGQGWAIDMRGQVLRTGDGGQHWRNVASPGLIRALRKQGSFMLRPFPGGNLIGNEGNGTAVAFPNPWTAWITTQPGNDTVQVWHTVDGGKRWTSAEIQRAAPGGPPMGFSYIAAVGQHDAWVAAATQGLAGHVDIRVWRTRRGNRAWQRVFQDSASGTSGLVFATGAFGVLTEDNSVLYGPHNAPLAVTASGGQLWQQTGTLTSPVRSSLPLLPGNWDTTVMAPAVVSHTLEVVVPVLMQRAFPPKSAPLKTWWRLEASTNGGETWSMLPTTPHDVLQRPPNLVFQGWATPQDGWVVLGSQLYRTVDGGCQWKASRLPEGAVVNLSRVSAMIGFVLVQRGAHTAIYRTRDGGLHWFPVS